VEHGSTDDPQTTNDAERSAESADPVRVTVGALADDRGFYVEDDGVGIPASERERVFEAGYSTADDGTGFGLRIVRDIVEAHGWSIDVTSGTDGGARFEITGVERCPSDGS
jgi:signal transduction histidine kinase